MSVVTPEQVTNRLKELSKLIDEAYETLTIDESKYHESKGNYEYMMAKTRIEFAGKSAPNGKNYTVGEREDMAILENSELHRFINTQEALVIASKRNVERLRVQVDIARSVGALVKMEMSMS
jgi:hypothetical protein